MKHLIIISFLLVSTKGFLQEPPAIFKFNFKQISKDSTDLFEKYEIRTFAYKEKIESVKNGHLDLINYVVEENGISNIQSKYEYKLHYYWIENNDISVYIDGLLPGTEEITLLSLRKIHTNQYFNIYVRFCRHLEIGEKVFLDKLKFKEGNYFYDMCESKEKYEIECQDDYNLSIDLSNLKWHRISINKLNKIKIKNPCE